MPTIYSGKKKKATNKKHLTLKELLEFLSLERPLPWSPSSFPYHTVPSVQRDLGGKADRRPPISLPTAMGSGCIPAVGLRGAGDRDLPLTGAGNPIFPEQEDAAGRNTHQGHLSRVQCPNRNTQTQGSVSLWTSNTLTGAASYLPL